MKKHHGGTEGTEKMDQGNTHPPCSPCLRGDLVLFVLVFAFAIRAVVILTMSEGLRANPDGYGRLAVNLVEYRTFGDEDVPTAFRPPLYPLLLTGCVALGDYGLKAIGILHVLLGVATVGLVLVLGRWWGLGRRASALAALLVACDPILLVSSAQVMTETLATFLTTAGLLALTACWNGNYALCWDGSCTPIPCLPQRDGSATAAPAVRFSRINLQILAGAILALAALCRPAFLLWAVAAGAVLWWLGRKNRMQKKGGVIASICSFPWAFALGAIVVLSPWAIRNQIQFGRPIVTTTHGGYTLMLANNPEFYQWLREGKWGSVWRADEFNAEWEQRRPNNELQADRQAYAEAWAAIHNEPGMFLDACAVRLGRFWSPLPHQTTAEETLPRSLSRYAVAAWYLLEYLCVAIGVRRMGRGERGERGEATKDVPETPDALTLALSQRESGHVESFEGKREHDLLSPLSPLLSPLSPLASPWLWGLLLVACLMAGHTIYWTDMRMRAPLMPVVALAAAWSFAAGRRAA